MRLIEVGAAISPGTTLTADDARAAATWQPPGGGRSARCRGVKAAHHPHARPCRPARPSRCHRRSRANTGRTGPGSAPSTSRASLCRAEAHLDPDGLEPARAGRARGALTPHPSGRRPRQDRRRAGCRDGGADRHGSRSDRQRRLPSFSDGPLGVDERLVSAAAGGCTGDFCVHISSRASTRSLPDRRNDRRGAHGPRGPRLRQRPRDGGRTRPAGERGHGAADGGCRRHHPRCPRRRERDPGLGSREAAVHQGAEARPSPSGDGGCVGCDAPPGMRKVHHIAWWKRHRGTHGSHAMEFLCESCHHRIHDNGWDIRVDGVRTTARVWLIPPPHIDPTRTPRPATRHRYATAA